MTDESATISAAAGPEGHPLTARRRALVVAAVLLALFLGALDALVVAAAMPSVVADLGGLAIYSWVYSAYFLARAVALPIFGKLSDRYPSRRLLLLSIGAFTGASLVAGAATTMGVLIAARVFQGLGAGGTFALVYVVLTDVAPPERRGRTLSLASSIWGIASVLGPTLGGFVVTYFSWRWVFLMNLPLGLLSMAGIGRLLVEVREKRAGGTLDLAGAAALTTAILALLLALLGGGGDRGWTSPVVLGALAAGLLAGAAFVRIERRAADPILATALFRRRGFAMGNAAVFCASCAIFSLFAYAPLFIQGALGLSPMRVGMSMLSLSFGWSLGSLGLGQFVDRMGKRGAAAAGGLLLVVGGGWTLSFSTATGFWTCFAAFFVVGMGMGFVTLTTLLVVQQDVDAADLGVATGTHQFSRTIGGTVGVGICGGIVNARLEALRAHLVGSGLLERLPHGGAHLENLFRPEIQAALPAAVQRTLQIEVAASLTPVFFFVTLAAVVCLLLCFRLPRST